MTIQDAWTPWGSGVYERPRAERELCADGESKWTEPRGVNEDSNSENHVFKGEEPCSAVDYPIRLDVPVTSGLDVGMNTRPLKVVYWNVAGINAGEIDTFLAQLDMDLQWDVLVLLEFSAARKETHLSGVRQSGHLVSAQPFEHGRRAGCLVFHQRLEIHEVTLVNFGRAFGADFSWGGWKIRIVGGHADANGDRVPYQNSIDDMEYIIENTPKDHIVILGADTQQCLGPLKAFDSTDIMGEYVMGHRDWRGRLFSETPLFVQPSPAAHFRRGLRYEVHVLQQRQARPEADRLHGDNSGQEMDCAS
jgi:hypothetical protein